MSVKYPFNRIVNTNFHQSKGVLSITGQQISEELNRGETEDDIDSSVNTETLNPQLFEVSYLMRMELEQVTDEMLYFLLRERKRTHEEILRSLQIIREVIWDYWDVMAGYEETVGLSDPSKYFTGIQVEATYPHSYRVWSIYSDPFSAFEMLPDNWLEQKKWMLNSPLSWAEVYAVTSLWMVDEAAVYQNLNNPYKASTWLVRAVLSVRYSSESSDESFDKAKKSFASLGGLGKKEKYKPLKEFVLQKVNSRHFPSRRNAAITLAPEVIQKARALGIGLSEHQAPITIASWLKEYGLLANK